MAASDHARLGVRPATVAGFVVLVVVAGGSAVAIRYSSCAACDLAPFWAAALRFSLASTIFATVALVRRTRLPRGRALLGTALFGALQFGIGFGLVYWGLTRAPAGLAQVLLACVPLLTFLLALLHRQERFGWVRLVGAALAIGGIAVVFLTGSGAGVPASSMAAILAGAVCWAEAFVVVKAFPTVDPVAMNAVAMAMGATILLVLTLVTGEVPALPVSGVTWAALAYLVVAGSVGVFWLYAVVLRHMSASSAAYQMVLIPLVTVALSALLQGERITWAFGLGAVAVLLGVYVGVLRRARSARSP